MGQFAATAPADDGTDSALLQLSLDYQLVGLATRFTIPVTVRERAQLEAESRVMLVGDAVEPVEAVVRANCGDLEADVEIIGTADGTALSTMR